VLGAQLVLWIQPFHPASFHVTGSTLVTAFCKSAKRVMIGFFVATMLVAVGLVAAEIYASGEAVFGVLPPLVSATTSVGAATTASTAVVPIRLVAGACVISVVGLVGGVRFCANTT